MKKFLALTLCILLCAGSAYADITDEIRSFLVSDKWKFDVDETLNAFVFSANIEGGVKRVNYLVPVREDYYIVYAISPVSARPDDADMMKRLTEFVCRVNYGLRNGNFDVDMQDGEIRYRTFVDCKGGTLPSREVIRQSIIIPMKMFERYSPGLLDVINKGTNATEALKKCEQ